MGNKAGEVDLQLMHNQADVQLLDDIDKLRSYGINHVVALPQLVVCGDQSSGKSSVLEAISGIPFPTKDNLCTRFATEVIMRRSSTESGALTISPGLGRPESEAQKLREFQKSVVDMSQFGEVIESAKIAMGLSDSGSAFTDDVLRIDISGPNRPHLTIVDLPGVIHSHNKDQSPEDVLVVQKLVRRYMTSNRSVILAVVSAKNDYANQIVLKMAREIDPRGLRTLGIITKPDTLPAGSDSEEAFLNLANNQEILFHLGWHVLKNRDYESRHTSSKFRDQDEENFFSQGAWSRLPRSTVGVASLRSRLSKVLVEQIKSEFPALMVEMEEKLAECRAELRKLGHRRQTADEQRRFLLHLAQQYQNLARAATDGVYEDPFFGDPRSDTGYGRRIRAVVQNLGLAFAETMRRRGHCYEISQRASGHILPRTLTPRRMSRDQYLEHAKILLTRSRGRELPGTFNPLLISDLFHEQAAPWLGLAQQHVETVWTLTRRFLESTVLHLAQDDTADNISREVVDPSMDQRLIEMSKTVETIIGQYSAGHPITYNHYFTETIQDVRTKRMEDDLTQRLRKFLKLGDSDTLEDLQFTRLKKANLISALSARNEADMDRYACAEAVDCMFAFYKVAMKNVVDNIAIQCVETQLMKSLRDVFSPALVIDMDSATVKKIAQESPASVDRRDSLERKAQMLKAGLETCRRHATTRNPTTTNHLRHAAISIDRLNEPYMADSPEEEESEIITVSDYEVPEVKPTLPALPITPDSILPTHLLPLQTPNGMAEVGNTRALSPPETVKIPMKKKKKEKPVA